MWDGYPKRVSIAKHLISLAPSDAKQIQTALWRARPRARELEENEMDRMLNRTKWAGPIVFAWKRDVSLRFFAAYQKQNAFFEAKRVFNATHGRVCWVPWQRHSIFNDICELCVLISRDLLKDPDKMLSTSHYRVYRFVLIPLVFGNVRVLFSARRMLRFQLVSGRSL